MDTLIHPDRTEYMLDKMILVALNATKGKRLQLISPLESLDARPWVVDAFYHTDPTVSRT